MTKYARECCECAIAHINAGAFDQAQVWLRAALKQTSNGKAWSKIMLAIRELSRIAAAAP